jgi:hypothetical protein
MERTRPPPNGRDSLPDRDRDRCSRGEWGTPDLTAGTRVAYGVRSMIPFMPAS